MTDPTEEPQKTPRRATAQAVADAAGVSRSAVSRAFTPGAYVDADKRRKIHEIAERMGYQPNALAAGLKGGRSHLVAILVGDMRSAYDTEFVSQLVGALNALNKWPILVGGDGTLAKTAIDQVLRYPLDALILRGGSMSAEIVAQCSKFGIPMISSGRPVDAPSVDNVCCCNADGTRLATEALLHRGRRRFGFIGGPADFASSAERRAGLVQALAASDGQLVAEVAADYTVEGGCAAARDLLRAHRVDALMCANDATAIGALAATAELGLAVPGDLSVVGFDNVAMAQWPMFNLSTVDNPIDAAVTQILGLLERRLANPSKPSETVLIAPAFIPRGTH